MERITTVGYRHSKRVYKEFKINYLSDYHDICVQSDLLLLEDVFENFRKKCTGIYKLDPAHFLSDSGLSWQACLKKTGVKLELLTHIARSLIIEKRTSGGICHSIHRYEKTNNKYMIKTKNRHISCI